MCKSKRYDHATNVSINANDIDEYPFTFYNCEMFGRTKDSFFFVPTDSRKYFNTYHRNLLHVIKYFYLYLLHDTFLLLYNAHDISIKSFYERLNAFMNYRTFLIETIRK